MSSTSLNVWAVGGSAPGLVREDACASDPSHAQPGWDVGVNYGGIDDLVHKLQQLLDDRKDPLAPPNSDPLFETLIGKLAISAHGGSNGEFYINGPGLPLRASDFATYLPQLRKIGELLEHNATIYLMGCLAGKGIAGTKLLNALSGEWSGRMVVGFTRIGQDPADGHCPGTKFGDKLFAAKNAAEENQREIALLSAPWASEHSPQAKVSRFGVLTKDVDPEYATFDDIPADVQFGMDYLIGKWDVEIGDWKGAFNFAGTSGSGTVTWTSLASPSPHAGTWGSFDGNITWDFKKDDRTDIRRFELLMPLRPIVQGKIYPEGQGGFKMAKR